MVSTPAHCTHQVPRARQHRHQLRPCPQHLVDDGGGGGPAAEASLLGTLKRQQAWEPKGAELSGPKTISFT
jgi:hypothetical protein